MYSERRESANIGSGALEIQCRVKDTMNRDEGFSVVSKWNAEASSPDSFEERVKVCVMGTKKEDRYQCGPRVLAQGGSRETAVQDDSCRDHLRATLRRSCCFSDGVPALRAALGAKPIQEAV